jgi:hypothetical protein
VDAAAAAARLPRMRLAAAPTSAAYP